MKRDRSNPARKGKPGGMTLLDLVAHNAGALADTLPDTVARMERSRQDFELEMQPALETASRERAKERAAGNPDPETSAVFSPDAKMYSKLLRQREAATAALWKEYALLLDAVAGLLPETYKQLKVALDAELNGDRCNVADWAAWKAELRTIRADALHAQHVASSSPKSPRPRPVALQASKETLAIALKAQHPKWKDVDIAEAAGCHVKSLHRFPLYQSVKKAYESDSLQHKSIRRPNDDPVE